MVQRGKLRMSLDSCHVLKLCLIPEMFSTKNIDSLNPKLWIVFRFIALALNICHRKLAKRSNFSPIFTGEGTLFQIKLTRPFPPAFNVKVRVSRSEHWFETRARCTWPEAIGGPGVSILSCTGGRNKNTFLATFSMTNDLSTKMKSDLQIYRSAWNWKKMKVKLSLHYDP